MGPTASGKTDLAVRLTENFPMDIVSVDSAMVYRTLDIGTAKPDPSTLAKAPHRLIDIRDPKDAYSAAQFRDDALFHIRAIFSQKRIPLLVGGTMLYFRALQKGLSDLPSADSAIRKKITEEAIQSGWDNLHADLLKVDPVAAARIHPHDTQRIQRALEVYRLTGKTLTSFQAASDPTVSQYTFYNLAIAPQDRRILHARIAIRFRHMLENGLVDEVRKLQARGDLTLDMPAIRSVGYRQVWEYLSGQCTFHEMETRGIIATRQLAKRQLTWLRSWPDVVWFDSEAADLYPRVADFILKHCQPYGIK
ncbi:MAG TPA: tRNA (adenosine(37)-N6)-dimethylallyltransferase MiaA [Gammaproteobacteria bacterium]|nr:tRNA (adenosine(37)-N6)-dimethylallyltransferase MiaA [Gammaproteobacteria bacterium]